MSINKNVTYIPCQKFVIFKVSNIIFLNKILMSMLLLKPNSIIGGSKLTIYFQHVFWKGKFIQMDLSNMVLSKIPTFVHLNYHLLMAILLEFSF